MTDSSPSPLNWRKATASQGSQGCVELAPLAGSVAVRDSKDPDGPMLLFDRDVWRRLATQVGDGELDLRR
ncbi:DUF397 domain-containing protein [Actinomadura bangladeshensis]|uniref:DUF397 domain-containing protein n=1 Tax=Actinomadura bangladeshensis TaxID=453573 RepID=A0A6L9QVC1_9ACTN|nr:DUF397 domain-containing protein [Actinomadura bangladeshensis]NEA29490.1 DUF397 domain-containing protein [Actinomadura bangladeshensis]